MGEVKAIRRFKGRYTLCEQGSFYADQQPNFEQRKIPKESPSFTVTESNKQMQQQNAPGALSGPGGILRLSERADRIVDPPAFAIHIAHMKVTRLRADVFVHYR